MRGSTVLWVSVGCLALAACGDKQNDIVAKACAAEAANRMAGKTFEIDAKAFAASAKAETADTFTLKAPVTFDKGLSTEYNQLCTCKARVDKNGATVLFMQFEWLDNSQLSHHE
jgi:hypothetical protein